MSIRTIRVDPETGIEHEHGDPDEVCLMVLADLHQLFSGDEIPTSTMLAGYLAGLAIVQMTLLDRLQGSLAAPQVEPEERQH